MARVKREGILRRVRAGRFWDRLTFDNLAELKSYLSDHLRFEHRVRWTPAVRARRAFWREDPFVVVRAIRFEVVERPGATH